jgi:gliding motility associated protien GldN
MKYLSNFSFVLILTLIASVSYAQNAEEVITESTVPAEDIYIDDVVSKRLLTEARVLPYEPVREADIAWEKRIWRIIDTREKMNLVWRAEQKPLFNIFKEMIENGDITVFKDETFDDAMTFQEVEEQLFKVDTIATFDYDTYEEKIEVVKNVKDWRNINRYRVKEIWFFDEEASVLKSRIIGIAPIMEEIVAEGAPPVVYALFWVYYPEARQYLAKHQVISDENDVAPMTWTDLLDNRYFSSYIFKRTNVLDYRVEDYFDPASERLGFDILLTSEKIKNELFNFEHDLWEY